MPPLRKLKNLRTLGLPPALGGCKVKREEREEEREEEITGFI